MKNRFSCFPKKIYKQMGSVLTTPPKKKESSEATCRVAQVLLLPAEYKGMINVRRGEKTHAVKDFLFSTRL